LLLAIPTQGKQVHDANIVATMLAYGIGTLFTLNIEDMKRFSGRIQLLPSKRSDPAGSVGSRLTSSGYPRTAGRRCCAWGRPTRVFLLHPCEEKTLNYLLRLYASAYPALSTENTPQ
jgi:hypothetical protein